MYIIVIFCLSALVYIMYINLHVEAYYAEELPPRVLRRRVPHHPRLQAGNKPCFSHGYQVGR